jgi:O-antigen ligase
LGATVAIWGIGVVLGFKVAVALLTLVAFLSAAVGLGVRPIGLIGISMLCTLDAMMRVHLMTGGLLRWNTFNYLLLLIMLLSVPLFLRRKLDVHSGLLLAFGCLLGAETPFTPGMMWATTHLLNLVTMFGILVYCARVGDDPDAWYWSGVINGTLSALGGALYLLHREALRMDENAWSYFHVTALFAICLAFSFCRYDSRRMIVLFVLGMANFGYVLLTGSRGSALVALACLGYLLSVVPGGSRKVMLLAPALAVVFLIVALFPSMWERSLHRFNKMFDPTRTAAQRTSGRSDLARGAWMLFCDRPFMGTGTGAFAPTWKKLHLSDAKGMEGYGKDKEAQAHSAWLCVLAENGLPGFLLFTAYVWSFAYVGCRKGRDWRSLGMFVSCGLATAFMSQEFFAKGIWLLAAGGTALLHVPGRVALSIPCSQVTGPKTPLAHPDDIALKAFTRLARV